MRVLFCIPAIFTLLMSSSASGTDTYSVLKGYIGRTIADFLLENPKFRAADMIPLKDSRVFILLSEPVQITTTLPPYTPPSRYYNNKDVGQGFENLSRALGTVPGATQTRTLQCRLEVKATHIGGNGADSWKIKEITYRGDC